MEVEFWLQVWPTSEIERMFNTILRQVKSDMTIPQDDINPIFKRLKRIGKKLLASRPVKYDRPNSPGHWEYGYIAEEMDSIGLSNLVFYDQKGLPENFNYEKMILYVVEVLKMHEDNLKALKESEAEVNLLKSELATQQKWIQSLSEQFSQMETEMRNSYGNQEANSVYQAKNQKK